MDGSSAIPPWLPPLVALVCSVVAGVTAFGDAILFHILFALCAAAGLVDRDRTALIATTAYIAVMRAANLPVMALAAGPKALRRSAPHALVLVSSGASCSPLGTMLLFSGDLTALKATVGAMFLLFSVVRLTSSLRTLGLARAAAAVVAGESGGALTGRAEAWAAEVGAGDAAAALPAGARRRKENEAAGRSPRVSAPDASTTSSSSSSSDGKKAHRWNKSDGGAGLASADALADVGVHASGRSLVSGELADDDDDGDDAEDEDAHGGGLRDRGGSRCDLPASRPVAAAPTAGAPPAPAPAGSPPGLASVVAGSSPAPSQALPSPQPAASSASALTLTAKAAAAPPQAAAAAAQPPSEFLCGCCTVASVSPVVGVRASFAWLFVTGAFAGVLNGAYGTGGPPQMVTFSLLRLDKEDIRAISAVYGFVELPIRLAVLSSYASSPFKAAEAGVYVAIVLASWLGFGLGNRIRRFTDTDAVLRILLLLVAASAGILLGALEDDAVAAAFTAGCAAWAALLAVLVWRPLWASRWMAEARALAQGLRGRAAAAASTGMRAAVPVPPPLRPAAALALASVVVVAPP